MAMTAGWRYLILAGLGVFLLRAQVDVNAAEPDGSTPLLGASYKDDLAGANRLIRAGANVNAANDLGVTPLWAASQNGSVAMVKKLLDAGDGGLSLRLCGLGGDAARQRREPQRSRRAWPNGTHVGGRGKAF